MLDLKKISEELNALMLTDASSLKDSELSKIKKRIQFLKTCEHYLESGPSKEFIQQEHSRLTKIISVILERFETWREFNKQQCAGKNYNEQKSFYERENNLRLLRLQLKTLTFYKK